jgi:hypothetical protein
MLSAIETTDLFRGAYLLCCGAHVIDTRVARHQVVFLIEGEGVVEHDTRYRLGTALVNPVQLRETLNLLRDLVFERLRPETERRRDHGPHPRHRDRAPQIHG